MTDPITVGNEERIGEIASRGLMQMLNADGGAIAPVEILQKVCKMSFLGLSEETSPKIVADWLRENAAYFDDLAAEEKKGMN